VLAFPGLPMVDPRVFQLLATGRQMLTTSLEGSREALADLEQMEL